MAPLPSTTTRSTVAAPSSSSPAAVFTNEEISMIQELFLNGAASAIALEPLKIVVDDALHITDIAIDSKADELMLGMDDATSVLLSPIGADDAFMSHFLVDETDAMAAFYTEAIDPFESPSPVKGDVAPAPASPRVSAETERTLAKLRAKVASLSTVYYTHCQRLQSGASNATAAVNVEKVKLVQALEKLQRVAAALTAANGQLATDTLSVREQHETTARDLESALSDAAHIDALLAAATDEACAAAIARATALARDFAVAGDSTETFGWSHTSAKVSDGDASTLSFKCEKSFLTFDAVDAIRGTVDSVGSTQALSALLGAHATVRAMKPLSATAAVVLVDIAQASVTRVDRTLALVFRTEAADGSTLLAACSLNPPADVLAAAPAVGAERVRWMESCVWTRLTPSTSEGESEAAVVTFGGSCVYASEAEARAMALAHVQAAVRWESAVVGPAFRF